MKNTFKNFGKSLLVVGALALATVAHATGTLDPAAATAISSVSDAWAEISPLVYTAMGLVTGGLVVFGLVKKVIRKVA